MKPFRRFLRSRAIATGVLLLAMTLTPVDLAAATKKDKAAKKSAPELDTPAKAVQDARQKLDDANKLIQNAKTAQAGATKRLVDARRAAARKLGPDAGLPAAMAEAESARATLAARQNRLIADWKKQGDYRDAVKAADVASIQLKRVRDDDALSPESRQAQSSALAAVIRRPADMQKAMLDGDDNLREAGVQLKQAEARLAQVRDKLHQAVEADPEVRDKLQSQEQLAADIAKARKELPQLQQTLSTAEAALALDQQQHPNNPPEDAKKRKRKPR